MLFHNFLRALMEAWGHKPKGTTVWQLLKEVLQNLPFGTKTEMVEIVPEQSVTQQGDAGDYWRAYIDKANANSVIKDDNEYTIVFNGKSEKMVVIDTEIEKNGNFLIEIDEDGINIEWNKDLGETITLAIYEEQEVVQPLDPKFVGASGGGAIFYNTGDGVNEYIYTDKNCTVKATKEDVVKVMYSPIFIEFTGGSDGTTTLDRVVSIFLNQAGSASLATVYRSSDGLTLSYYYTAEHSDGPA